LETKINDRILGNESKWLKFFESATAEDEIPVGWENNNYEQEIKDLMKVDYKIQIAN